MINENQNIKTVLSGNVNWRCSKCDFSNKGTTSICANCGADRGNAPSVKTSIIVREVPKKVNHEIEWWTCPNCDYRNKNAQLSCYSCGLKRPTATTYREPKKIPPVVIVIAVCIVLFFIIPMAKGLSDDNVRVDKQVTTASPTAQIADGEKPISEPSSSDLPSKWIEYISENTNIDVTDYNEIKSATGKYMLTVYISGPENVMSLNLTVRAMHNDVEDILKELQKCNTLESVNIYVQGKFYDNYGRESIDNAMRVTISKETIDKIEFDSTHWDSSNLEKISDSYWRHKSLYE